MASGVAIFSSFIQPISAAVRAVLRRIYVLDFLHAWNQPHSGTNSNNSSKRSSELWSTKPLPREDLQYPGIA